MISLETHGYILCFSSSEVLSIKKKFSAILHTRLSTPTCVFHADFACKFINHLLRGFLAEQGALSQFSCRGPNAQNCLLSIVTFLRQLVIEDQRISSTSLLGWGCVCIHLPDQQSSFLALQGDIPLECLFGRSHAWLHNASFVLLRLIPSSCPSNWLLSILNVSS